MKVMVHQAKPYDPIYPKVILDAIADAFTSLNYEVTRWRSAFKQEFPADEQFDCAVFWCGFQDWFVPIKAHLDKQNTKMLFCDVDHFGLYHDQGAGDDMTFQLNYAKAGAPMGGVNGFPNWQDTPLTSPPGESVKVGPGDLLVLLQDDTHFRHKFISPMFRTGAELITHLGAASAIPLRVRAHPVYGHLSSARAAVSAAPNAYWDDSQDIHRALNKSCAVASVDSHAAVVAIQRGMPVLCYGQAIYHKEGVAWLCKNEEDTRRATAMLRDGKCDLDSAKQKEFITLLQSKTWHLSELPGRLETILKEEMP